MPILKRSLMTLFSGPQDYQSHHIRFILAEKAINVSVVQVHDNAPPADFIAANPYRTLPTLVDRDLVLYEPAIIAEYLDERFPHPPLLPVYPVAKAKIRMMLHRIEKDWYALARTIIDNTAKERTREAKRQLQTSLLQVSAVFTEMPFFLSEEFSLLDCFLGPLLWRLPILGINLPKQGSAIMQYAEKIFKRDSFDVSLTEIEREMRFTHDI